MISQKYLFSILFVVATFCVFLCHSSPVPSEGVPTNRKVRFYGLAGSQASAMASAGAGGYGYPGFGGSSAMASAMASSNGFAMYGK